MKQPIHQITATVCGAGTMGAGIAAHLAAAGCKTYLLDIVPAATPADAPATSRSSIAHGALKNLLKSKPPALMSPKFLKNIEPGNFDDDLQRAAAESDIVIEAVVERLDVKQELFRRLAAAAGPETIFGTNTSGIPIGEIAEALPEDVKRRFLGLHF
ncbi:MAG: 3-hydroxyacyl-CoA dehydrogenase NAD-binding domain-containing protein, partial [Polyangiaceae bacterium]|nr:3-hydroxyacyl-CoA dehydrogenase NAD-binding domain-containing protein [Polyangiaceae bacterium]